MLKIITLYTSYVRKTDNSIPVPVDMSYGRWFKITEALARAGHQVDMAVSDHFEHVQSPKTVRRKDVTIRMIPLSQVNWDAYDVIKTEFHGGFQTLKKFGGTHHPFIISKLGSVVAPEDRPGIYFYGDYRKRLYETQCEINTTSRYVTVLNDSAVALWEDCFGNRENTVVVPGGVDRFIPEKQDDPYPGPREKRCLFAGNIYDHHTQPEANRTLVKKLNDLGRLLSRQNMRLYLLGRGDTSELDKRYVTYLGVVTMNASWQYLYHADVGLVVCAGKFQHNNESSKIYHYLRAGLPVVSERGFPNDHVVRSARLGEVVKNDDMEALAKAVVKAASRTEEERQYAIDYILAHHTWDQRVRVYDQVFKRELKLAE